MNFFKLGVILIFIGMILAIIAVFLPLVQVTPKEISVSGGGCIIVGFIPVCFGTGEYALVVIIVALVLAIALIAISLVFTIHAYRKVEKTLYPRT